MTLVLYASAAIKLAVEEPDSPAVRGMVAGVPLAAPELVLAAIGNALGRKSRLGAIGAEPARVAQARIARLFDQPVPLRALQDQALDLALRRDHPVCDRFYVALAMREAAPLLTADRRLVQRFGGDVEVRLPAAWSGRSRQTPSGEAPVSGKRPPRGPPGRAGRPAPPRRG